MRVIVFIMCFIVLGAVYSHAGIFPSLIDWEIGAEWSSLWYMEGTQNNDAESEVMSDNRALLENDISWEERDIYAAIDLEWRYETFKGMEDESRSDVRFREVYAEFRQDGWRASAGKKIITWGKLDDLVVLDRIVPQDFSHFVLYDKQERKDPAWMLQHEWFIDGDFQLETVFLPVFEASDLDFFGSTWAVFDHLKESVSAGSYTASQKASVAGISIREDDRVTDHSLDNSQIALRLRGRKADVDYGIYYLNLYHSLPVLRETSPLGNTVKQFLYDPSMAHLNALTASGASGNDLLLTEVHPRVHTLGADWETVWGELGLRGEAALFFGMPYLAEDFSYTEKNQISIGFGVDHTTENEWYFDVQYLQDYVFNYSGLYGMEESPCQFAGTISKDFMRGVFHAGVDWVWNASYGDWMLNPELVYHWDRPGISVAVGAFVFQDGTSRSVFGRYDSNDVVYLKVGGEF